MPYYAGDYYQGDYYQGDPFLAPLIGGIARAGLRILPKVARGAVGGVVRTIGRVIRRHPVATSTLGTIATERAISRAGATAPPGMRPRKGLKGAIERILPGGETGFYKTRRMNVLNVKALRRAGRRVRGFLKIARRLGAVPISAKGKKLFKQRRPCT